MSTAPSKSRKIPKMFPVKVPLMDGDNDAFIVHSRSRGVPLMNNEIPTTNDIMETMKTSALANNIPNGLFSILNPLQLVMIFFLMII